MESGYNYLRARYYDPTIGRFITADNHWNVGNMLYGDDPIKFWGIYVPLVAAMIQSGNLYVYCMNNPLLYVDYSGEWSLLTTVLATIAIAATVVAAGAYTAAIVSENLDSANNPNIMLSQEEEEPNKTPGQSGQNKQGKKNRGGNKGKKVDPDEFDKQHDLPENSFHRYIKKYILQHAKPNYQIGKKPDILINGSGDNGYQDANGHGYMPTGLNVKDVLDALSKVLGR